MISTLLHWAAMWRHVLPSKPRRFIGTNSFTMRTHCGLLPTTAASSGDPGNTTKDSAEMRPWRANADTMSAWPMTAARWRGVRPAGHRCFSPVWLVTVTWRLFGRRWSMWRFRSRTSTTSVCLRTVMALADLSDSC